MANINAEIAYADLYPIDANGIANCLFFGPCLMHGKKILGMAI